MSSWIRRRSTERDLPYSKTSESGWPSNRPDHRAAGVFVMESLCHRVPADDPAIALEEFNADETGHALACRLGFAQRAIPGIQHDERRDTLPPGAADAVPAGDRVEALNQLGQAHGHVADL